MAPAGLTGWLACKTLVEAGQGAIFDAALTVCLMRYISDRHMGKINPEHFKFGLNVEEKRYDLPAFLRQRLVNGRDVNAELAQIGPPFAGYNRTLQALQRYLQLAPQDDGEKLPDCEKASCARKSLRWHSTIDAPCCVCWVICPRTRRFPKIPICTRARWWMRSRAFRAAMA